MLEPRFLPNDPRPDPAQALYRLIAAHALAAHQGSGALPGEILKERWPKDRAATALFERSASVPATTGTSGWADALAISVVGNFLASLKDSAGAALMIRAPRIDPTGAGHILLPYASATGTSAWVAEGAPAPLGMGTTANASIAPRKIMLLLSLTREMLEHSPDLWVQTVLGDSATAALDASLFSNVAGDSTRPPGLTAGITALTASTATVGQTAAVADFRALADSIAAVAGGELMFFASPGRAIAAQAYLPALAPQIYGSAYIPATALYAVAVNSFTSAFDAVPSILATRAATAHYEDSLPLPISSGPAGSTAVAAPVRGTFQMDLVLLRMTLKAGWGLRVPASAAWISAGMGW